MPVVTNNLLYITLYTSKRRYISLRGMLLTIIEATANDRKILYLARVESAGNEQRIHERYNKRKEMMLGGKQIAGKR